MKVSEFLRIVDQYAPFDSVFEGDNVGLIIGELNEELGTVYISLDINLNIAKKAVKHNCSTIITHHPIFFNKIQKIINDDYRLIQYLIKNNVTLISLHSNIDFKNNIISKLIFKKLNLKASEFSNHIDGCAIYDLEESLSSKKLFTIIKEKHNTKYLRFNKHTKSIKRIAIIGGSGASEYDKLQQYNPDCFLTGDVKFNYFSQTSDMIIVDIGHESEVVFVDLMKKFCLKYNINNVTDYEKFVQIF